MSPNIWPTPTIIRENNNIGAKRVSDSYLQNVIKHVKGNGYSVNQVVTQDGWAMVSNASTMESPAPTELGSPFWMLDITAEGWTIQNEIGTRVAVGQDFSSVKPVIIKGTRIYVSTVSDSIYYRASVAVYNNPELPDIYYSDWIQSPTTGWVDAPFTAVIVPSGVTVVVTAEYKETTGKTVDDVSYNYTSNNEEETVAIECMHRVNNRTYIDVHKTPRAGSLSVDPLPGTTITSAESDWIVTGVTDNDEYWRLDIIGNGFPADGLIDFAFSTPSETTEQYYFENSSYWATHSIPNATVSGTKKLDNTVTSSTNAYGADIYVQEILLSLDWDLLSPSPNTANDSSKRIIVDLQSRLKAMSSKVAYNDSALDFSTTSTTYVTADSNVTGVMPKGVYKLGYTMKLGATSVENTYTISVLIDGVEINEWVDIASHADVRKPLSANEMIVSFSGNDSHTLSIKLKVTGTNTVTLYSYNYSLEFYLPL